MYFAFQSACDNRAGSDVGTGAGAGAGNGTGNGSGNGSGSGSGSGSCAVSAFCEYVLSKKLLLTLFFRSKKVEDFLRL